MRWHMVINARFQWQGNKKIDLYFKELDSFTNYQYDTGLYPFISLLQNLEICLKAL